MVQTRGVVARLALILSTVIWGSSFLIMKNTLDSLHTFSLLAIRFSGACLLLAVVFWGKVKQMRRQDLWHGFVMGTLLFIAYTVQTFGLDGTTPGKNAFLTAAYCIFVPFFYWLFSGHRPDRYNVIAAVLCIAGIGCVSLDGTLTIQPGDFLSALCGVFYALHILATARFTKNGDAFLLTVLQFFFAGVWGWVLTALFRVFPSSLPMESVFSLGYLCVFATGVALLCQSFGQKYTSPSSAALLLSLEAVFGVLFSLAFRQENLSVQLIIGFVLIFISILISETKLSFLKGEIPHRQKGE